METDQQYYSAQFANWGEIVGRAVKLRSAARARIRRLPASDNDDDREGDKELLKELGLILPVIAISTNGAAFFQSLDIITKELESRLVVSHVYAKACANKEEVTEADKHAVLEDIAQRTKRERGRTNG